MANKTTGDAFLNEYDNLGSLGEGGYARVVMARHREFGYVRALKIQDRMVDGEDDPLYVRFKEECGTLMRLGNGCHPNIIRMYKFGLFNNHAFAEMDYVDGCSLHDYLKDFKETGLPWDEVYRFVEDISSALAYCHVDVYKYLMDREADELESSPDDGLKIVVSEEKEQELIQKYRVIHNDVHTNNVMRRHYDGHYVLLDFGLCIQNQTQAGVRSSQRKNGACEYVSPEKSSRILDGVNESNSQIIPQEDVYSMGIMIYETICGQPPFYMRNESDAERHRVYKGHLSVDADEVIDRLKEKRPDTPDWICDILRKCLQRNPYDRYSDGKQLLLDFRQQSEKHRQQELEERQEECIHLRLEMDELHQDLVEKQKELDEKREECDLLKTDNDKLRKELASGGDTLPAPSMQNLTGGLGSVVLSFTLLSNLLVAYKCYANSLLFPSLLFLGLIGALTYMSFNKKEQGGNYYKAIAIVLLVTYLLVAFSVYRVLMKQQVDITLYLAIGGISLLAYVAMIILKPSNKKK